MDELNIRPDDVWTLELAWFRYPNAWAEIGHRGEDVEAYLKIPDASSKWGHYYVASSVQFVGTHWTVREALVHLGIDFIHLAGCYSRAVSRASCGECRRRLPSGALDVWLAQKVGPYGWDEVRESGIFIHLEEGQFVCELRQERKGNDHFPEELRESFERGEKIHWEDRGFTVAVQLKKGRYHEEVLSCPPGRKGQEWRYYLVTKTGKAQRLFEALTLAAAAPEIEVPGRWYDKRK